MGDSHKKAQRNQRLQIPAEAYNAFMDTVRQSRSRQHSVEQDPGDEFRQSTIVKVKNASGKASTVVKTADTPMRQQRLNRLLDSVRNFSSPSHHRVSTCAKMSRPFFVVLILSPCCISTRLLSGRHFATL